MRVINRTAVSITGAQPYIDWTRRHDAAADRGMLTVAHARPYGTAYLLPELELEEDVQEWVEENAPWLFEFQLSAWTDDESAWPQPRDLSDEAQADHRQRLAALRTLDGVVDLKVGEDVVRSPRSYDTGLMITFADRAALDAYQKNDRHVPVSQLGVAVSEHIV